MEPMGIKQLKKIRGVERLQHFTTVTKEAYPLLK